MSVNVFLYSVSGFWTCVKISPPKKPNTASKTSFIRRSNRRLSFECFQDRHDARHEKCDQEDRDDYLCADSFPCGIRLLARTNYHIPACHYPVKLSEEITHDQIFNHNAPCAVKRQESLMTSGRIVCYPSIQTILARSCERVGHVKK